MKKKMKMKDLIQKLDTSDFDPHEMMIILNTSRGLRIDKPVYLGRSLIHLASMHSKGLSLLKMMSTFPEYDVDIIDQINRNTPLHLACREGCVENVRFILQLGCKVNLQDKDGYTALHFACCNGRLEIVKMLLETPDIKINTQDTYLRTAVHRAVEKGEKRVVEELLKKKPNLNIVDKNNQTCLHYASYLDNNEMCVLLCKSGAKTNIKDSQGKKSLYWGFGYFQSPQNPTAMFHYCNNPNCGDENHKH